MKLHKYAKQIVEITNTMSERTICNLSYAQLWMINYKKNKLTVNGLMRYSLVQFDVVDSESNVLLTLSWTSSFKRQSRVSCTISFRSLKFNYNCWKCRNNSKRKKGKLSSLKHFVKTKIEQIIMRNLGKFCFFVCRHDGGEDQGFMPLKFRGNYRNNLTNNRR